jgi:hypothetical protein
MSGGIRWYPSDGLLAKRFVSEDAEFTLTLSPTGAGPLVTVTIHANWRNVYAVPGDESTGPQVNHGNDLTIRQAGTGVIVRSPAWTRRMARTTEWIAFSTTPPWTRSSVLRSRTKDRAPSTLRAWVGGTCVRKTATTRRLADCIGSASPHSDFPSKTVFPSNRVRTVRTLWISPTGVSKRFRFSTTRSASFPTSIEPLSRSI